MPKPAWSCCFIWIRPGRNFARRPHEFDGRSLRRRHRRRGAAHPAEDHDHLRHPVWFAADHVVARHAIRRGRDETHRRADDRRRDYLGYFGTADLPGHFVLWRRRHLPAGGLSESSSPGSVSRKRATTLKGLIRFLTVASIAAVFFAGGYAAWNWWNSRPSSSAQTQGEPIATGTVDGLTIGIYGDLHNGQSEVLVRFTDSNGQPKDVGDVRTDLNMNMPGMVMNSGGDVTRTSNPGVYRVKLQARDGR